MSDSNKPRLRFFENAPSQQHIAKDDRYLYKRPEPSHRLVVIGTGTIGQEHMRVSALLGRAEILGIYDVNSHSMDAAETSFKQHSNQPLIRYESLEAACFDANADALMICTPNFTHFEILQTAIKSGKPIFLEKPMATRLEDAAQIVSLAESYASFIQIGLQYRYKAQYVEAFHEVLSRKTLGEIKTISISEYRPPFLDKVKQWNKFNEFSGGTLVEKCCHYFDLMNLMAESKPARVFASGGQAVNFLDFEREGKRADIDDHAYVIVEYANGIRANFTLNMFSPAFAEEMIVVGPQGRLVTSEKVDFHHLRSTECRVSIELGEQGASRSTDVGYPSLIEQSGHHGATYFEHIAFLDQLEEKPVDSATALQGLWSMIVASAAQQSIKTGLPINIEEFITQQQLAEAVAEK